VQENPTGWFSLPFHSSHEMESMGVVVRVFPVYVMIKELIA